MPPKISAVVITRNEASNLRRTVENLQDTLPGSAEIVVVDDGSTDGSADFLTAGENRARLVRSNDLGVAGARNWGARHATGDILIFADAHIAAPSGWWIPMVELLANPSVGAVAPAVADIEESACKGFGLRLAGPDLTVDWIERQGDQPYQVPLLPGCCWAMRRDTFEATGGFDGALIRWAGDDTELSLRLWLLGYELWLAPQVEVVHLFREERPFHVEWSWVLHNRLRMAFVHFDTGRITRVVEALRDHEDFAAAVALTAASDASARRAALAARRLRSDDWFFERFGLGW
jgi:glycosyltransferase involved in cell wall biosynthesis